MFSRFTSKRPPTIVGIDLGTQFTRAVVLSRQGQQLVVEACAQHPSPRGAIVEHQIQDLEKLTLVLRQLRKQIPANVKEAAAAVSGANVITKILHMDKSLSELELEIQVELEAENAIPFPLDEVSLDFEVLGESRSDAATNNVLLSAARAESVQARATVLNDAGFDARIIDVASHALGRACELFDARLPKQPERVVAMVDIGFSSMTCAMVYGGETIYAREQNFGGDNLTQALLSQLGCDWDEAERTKLHETWSGDRDTLVLAPFITTLLQHLRRNIQLFCSSSGLTRVDAMILSGGCSRLPGLVNTLRQELDIPVFDASVDEVLEFANERIRDHFHQQGGTYLVALGLAMRSFLPCRT